MSGKSLTLMIDALVNVGRSSVVMYSGCENFGGQSLASITTIVTVARSRAVS